MTNTNLRPYRSTTPKPPGLRVQSTGKALIALGVLLFAFVAYQLWGTALITSRAQSGLERDFAADVQEASSDDLVRDTLTKLETITVSTITSSTETVEVAETIETTTSASPFDNLTAEELAALGEITYKPQGEAIAQIIAENMFLDSIVVSGTTVADLRKGPGWYAESAALCSTGNAAIAGHRTTYGSPFGDIQRLKFGDTIQVNTSYGNCIYTVTQRFVVQPNETWVVQDQGDNRLTLTSCHPKYSAEQRYVVVAQLTETNVPYLPTQAEIAALIAATSVTTTTTEEVITTKEVITTEQSTEEVQVEVPVTCEDCEQANTVGSANGFGTGLDGEGKSELLSVILYGIIFFMVWFRVWQFAYMGWGWSSYTNMKGEFVAGFRNVAPTKAWRDTYTDGGAYTGHKWVTTPGHGRLENFSVRQWKLTAYAIGAIPMLVAAAFWFYHVDLMLPSY